MKTKGKVLVQMGVLAVCAIMVLAMARVARAAGIGPDELKVGALEDNSGSYDNEELRITNPTASTICATIYAVDTSGIGICTETFQIASGGSVNHAISDSTASEGSVFVVSFNPNSYGNCYAPSASTVAPTVRGWVVQDDTPATGIEMQDVTLTSVFLNKLIGIGNSVGTCP